MNSRNCSRPFGGHGRGSRGVSYRSNPSYERLFKGCNLDENAKFADFTAVEGVRVVTDFDQACRIRGEMRNLVGYLLPPMPVNWPVTLTREHLHILETSPYVARLKPDGPRYLLYVDREGDIFMENNTRSLFQIDEDHALQILDFQGRPLKSTLLDGIITMPATPPESPNKTSRVTYLIHDAIYCNGRNLKDLGVIERLQFIQDEIMTPRRHMIASNLIDVSSEPFDLDTVGYVSAARAEKYLQDGFLEEQKYSFKSIVFHSRHEGYVPILGNVFYWDFGTQTNFDFLLKVSPKGEKTLNMDGDLFVTDRGKMKKFGTIPMTEELLKLDGCIITCFYSDHQWIFHKRRYDRLHPNGLKAATGKFSVVQNPVTKEQLLATLEKSEGQE